jgi:AraC family transcriptional regulator
VERVELRRNGAHAVKASTGSFALQKLRFPAGHRIRWFEPEWGYLALVLAGAMQKRFSTKAWLLRRDSLATLPRGAGHATDFGIKPTHVLTIYPCTPQAATLFERFLRERRQTSAPAAAVLGRRIACELTAPDASSGLAVEGLVLQLLAMGQREATPSPSASGWLATVVEVLHEQAPRVPALSELAAEAGVHPGHLARSFRRALGVTVCEYSRRLRLEWAAAALEGDATLAQVALDAGFADQSHFTRAFRSHSGVTPGRYRELLRR